jgi:glycosyltransferase involved in cell wall biosynthesis
MTEHIPRVTIGIPVYNGAEFLREALDSIVAQTFEDFEVIVSDNASEDATAEICSEYAARDPRITWVRSGENRGAAWNYNRVAELARGTYFKWAAHDDWLAATYLERCVEELDSEGPGTILAYPRTILVCDDPAEREFYGGPRVRYEDRLDTRHPDPIRRLRHVAKHLDLCNPVMGLFRREALLRTGLIRPFSGSDVLLLSEISLLGEIHEIPEWLFYRRRHSRASRLENSTRKTVARWFSTDNQHAIQILTPGVRLLWEHVRLVWGSKFSVATRIRGVIGYLATRLLRWARVRGGRYKRRLLGQPLTVRSQAESGVGAEGEATWM